MRLDKLRQMIPGLVMAVLLLTASFAQAETPAQLATRVQKANAKLNNLAADYMRISRFVALGPNSGRQVKASGRLLWARPWNLRLEQAKPREQLVVAGPQAVWWVRASRKQADHYPVAQFTSGLKPLMEALGGLSNLGDTFVVASPTANEAKAADGAPALALIPKVKRADLARLVVWFDAGSLLVKGFRMVSMVGDVTEYRLSNVKANGPVAEDAFTFHPPGDFKVRDHRPTQKPR